MDPVLAERYSGIGLKLFGFIAESVFTFIPECVRVHPGLDSPNRFGAGASERASGGRKVKGYSAILRAEDSMIIERVSALEAEPRRACGMLPKTAAQPSFIGNRSMGLPSSASCTPACMKNFFRRKSGLPYFCRAA